MLLGYNQKRPTRENYSDFERKLVEGLEKLGIPGLSLMFYGSYVRGDYNPGRSDIDALMVFPDDVIIDKHNLAQASRVLYEALVGNNVPFQVTVADITTMREGRFNTYDESFKSYFNEEGRIVVGPDYRGEFRFELPTMDEQIAVRFNLRKARTGLLFAEHDRKEDYELFLSRFTKTLDSTSRGSKQVLSFIDGKVRKNRFSGISSVQEIFPEVNTEALLKIKDLYHNPEKIDVLYQNPGEVMSLWNSSVTFFEELIRAYIQRFPNPRNNLKA